MGALVVVAALAAGGGYWAGTGLGVPADARSGAAAGTPAGAVDQGAAPSATGERTILYYRNPMGLPDTSPVPKKDSMGMDYIPVYADEQPDDAGVVRVSPARVQTLGVRTAVVESRTLAVPIRASGRVEIDERAQAVVAPRFDGWIERLHVRAVGDVVRKGQPLFSTYSPELQSAGEELRIAERLQRDSSADPVAGEAAARLAEATRARLRNLQVGGQAGPRQTLHAPVAGIVLDKAAIEGARFAAGEALFRIADLSRVWVVADVYERDLSQIRPGQHAQVTLDAFPGRAFEARVDYLYPTLNTATRSTPLRLELDNPDGVLRPGMFARVELETGGVAPTLVVPASAVIDDGERQVVLMALDEGRFQPRPVRLGARGGDFVEVREGVQAGERVVVSANFLIDSESQLRAALSNMNEAAAPPPVHEAEGRFEAFDAELGSVTLTHGEIPALKWPEMTMDFGLASPELVRGLAPGAPIRFRFEERGPGDYVVTRIEGPGDAATPAAEHRHD
ncbi:MAG: rane fusion protein copper/silver efflux system [Thauera sp.]|nr:efflux RND transporter periplasmic adaptor subunit [Thauera sp.]MDI3490566.1 rane fusion protein copper/silver efflux system [Thauera sp.]